MSEYDIAVTVCVEKDDQGYYAYAPGLKGLHVGGKTKEEVLENAEDGITLYLNSLAKHDEPLPEGPYLRIQYHDDPLTKETKEISVPRSALYADRYRDDPLTKEISVSWTSQKMRGNKSEALPQKN